MLKDNGREVKERRNYHMTTEELGLLFDYSKRWSSKFQLLVAICAFRGLRISEASSINILDFRDDNFDKLTYREAKTNKMQQNRPIIKPLADMIKAYVYTNRHLLKDGYLFPFYNSKSKAPHMTTGVAEAFFSKMRKIIGRDHINFLDKYEINTENGKIINRYRISFHSLRRWFETHLLHEDVSVYAIKEIMNYSDYEPLNCYLNRFEIIDQEPEILNKAFSSVFETLNKNG